MSRPILSVADFFQIPSTKGEFKVRGRATGFDDCRRLQNRCSDIAREIQIDDSHREHIAYLLRIEGDKSSNASSSSLWIAVTDGDLGRINWQLGFDPAEVFLASEGGLSVKAIEVYRDRLHGLAAWLDPVSNQVTYVDTFADKAISPDGSYPPASSADGTTESDLYVHKTTGAELWVAREGLVPEARRRIEEEFVKKKSLRALQEENASGGAILLPQEHLRPMQQAVADYRRQYASRLARIAAFGKQPEDVWTLAAATISASDPYEASSPLVKRNQIIVWRLLNIGSAQ